MGSTGILETTLSLNDRSISLGEVVRVAREAGDIILQIYDADDVNWNVQAKADDSPLTKADLAANKHICAELRRLYADIPIMSEENKNAEYETRAKWSAYWCVDPLDGTKEFMKRNGEFTVNIALMKADPSDLASGARPVLGVVHAPVLEKTYFAAKEAGAYLKEAAADPKEIKVMEFSEEDEGLTLVCSRSHLDERTQAFLDKYKGATSKSMGSSLKFMLVAAGDAHVYPRLAPTMEWDTAASQIVVEEAGGVVLHSETMKPMRYNKENLLNPYFIVYGKRVVH